MRCSWTLQATTVVLLVRVVTIGWLYAGSYTDGNSTGSLPWQMGTSASRATQRASARNLDESVCFAEQPSPALEQFVDGLPIIPTIDVSNGRQLVMGAYKIFQKLHRDLPVTISYAFGTSQDTAQVPGPALIARRHVPSYIRWENHILDQTHFLAVDPTVTLAVPPRGGVPVVPHIHGMESESIYDGHPEAWFTSGGDTGHKYMTQNYTYLNSVLPGLVWYHDHVLGMTRVNVVAGLAGPYIVRGADHEEPMGLPDGDQDIILMVQDKQFFANGSINFPSVGDDPAAHPNWCPGYYGDTVLVNGKVWPYLDVLPIKYRLRFLNAGSERYFRLSLDRPNMTFLKIGTDGGYLPTPVVLDEILLMPAERADCIVDFGGLPEGTRIILNNSAPAPFPGGPNFPAPFSTGPGARAVLQFRVGASSTLETSIVPTNLAKDFGLLSPAGRARVRRFSLTETINNVGNGTQVLLANRTWDAPATEFGRLGTTEVWEFIGLTPGVDHPIHIHLIRFQFLSAQLLNVTSYNARTCTIDVNYGHPNSCFLGESRGPNGQEIGWKDVVSASNGAVTRIVMRYTSQDGGKFPFDPTHGPGYVWHCHLLSHEDNSMMRPLHIKYPSVYATR